MRHDEKYLRLIYKHVGEKEYARISQLPFFYFVVPEKWMKSPGWVNIDIVKDHIAKELSISAILPFPEFTFVIEEDPCLHHVKWLGNEDTLKETWIMDDFFLPTDYPQHNNFSVASMQTKGVEKGLWVHQHKMTTVTEYKCKAGQFYRRKELQNISIEKNFHAEMTKIYERNHQDFVSLSSTILALFCTAEEKHQRLVRVTKQPTTGSQKPSKKTSKDYSAKYHYIYLDEPPAHVVNLGADGEARRSVRGHARKAHWHRLMHPRFKNHPQYGEKIRIRATWVGPVEWVDQGKIYALHNPEDL